jgi:hypothetical protein
MPGVGNLIVEARAALLDAVAALEAQKDSVTLIGAQAIYLRTGSATFALAEATKDTDLAIDPRKLGEDPRLEEAMTKAGFILDPVSRQPGAWMSPNGIPVDLMVPEHLAGSGSRRGVRIPPHDKHSARRAAGLEAAIIDRSPMSVESLDDHGRSAIINVAGPVALLVAKLHKLGERVATPNRLNDKDAHDIYRLRVAIDTADRATTCEDLRRTRYPMTSRRRRWATWSNSSQAQMPSALRWAVPPRKESASQTRFRLRSACSRRTCCQPWRDSRRGPAVFEPGGLTP